MKRNKILAAGPSITNLEIKTVNKMMRSGWEDYSYVEKFERKFSKFHNRKFGLMTPSCTLAIHLILKTLKIGNGDEVIVPVTTWTATIAPVIEVGAKPVFIDVKVDDWCIDEKLVEKKINKKTKAIIVVDLYGNMPKINKLLKIAKKYKIFLIEDAAEALGSKFNNIRAGKFGIASVHSFHRTKTITSGEGGFLLIDDRKFYKRAKFLRDLGRSKIEPYIANEISLKYMPSNFQASLAFSQFKRINKLLMIKKKIFNLYKYYLNKYEIECKMNVDKKPTVNGYWATTIVLNKKYKTNIKKIQNQMMTKGVPIRRFFAPLTSQKGYFNFKKKEKFVVAENLYKQGITLPSHYNLTEKQIKFVCYNLSKIL